MSTEMCDRIGHGPAAIDNEPVPKSDCLVCENLRLRVALQAIADLTNSQKVITGYGVDVMRIVGDTLYPNE